MTNKPAPAAIFAASLLARRSGKRGTSASTTTAASSKSTSLSDCAETTRGFMREFSLADSPEMSAADGARASAEYPAARSKNEPLMLPSTNKTGSVSRTMTMCAVRSSDSRSSFAAMRASTTCGPGFVKRWRNSTVVFCPGTSKPTARSSALIPSISIVNGPEVIGCVPVFSTVTRMTSSRSIPTRGRDISRLETARFRNDWGVPKSRSISLGGDGIDFHALSRRLQAEGSSKRQPDRCESVKTAICLDALVPVARPKVAMVNES